MKTCSLNDFMQQLTPWLSRDYIRQAYVDEKGEFVLHFVDGIINVYHIDDCSGAQIKAILKDLEKKGIPVTNEGPH